MFRIIARLARSTANGVKYGSPAVMDCARKALTTVTASGGSSQGSRTTFPFALALTTAAAALVVPAAYATSQERSFIMIKPDGVHRGLIGDIIKRFEAKGYKLVGIKVLVPTAELAGQHYAEHEARPFFPKLVNFLSSGPVIAMVWEGKDVIKYGRTMIGATNPLASAPGTIRGDYGIDVGRNIIHGSDAVESAQREIALWFRPEELAEYDPATKAWLYE